MSIIKQEFYNNDTKIVSVFNTKTKLLILKGFGDMKEIKFPDKWYEITYNVRTCIVYYGITSLAENIFENCTNLKYVILPKTINVIKNRTFFGCVNLKRIKLPHNIKVIESEAFSCSGLKQIKLPKYIKRINSSAFYKCRNLTKIKLPKSIDIIADSVFRDCMALKHIYYSGMYKEWRDILRGKSWDDNTGNYMLHFSKK